MITKIKLALDGSEHSRSVVRHGLWLAPVLNARVSAVHVVDVVALEGPFLHDLAGSLGFEPFLNFSSKMREALEEGGRAILDAFKAEGVKERVETDTRLLTGIVTSEICEDAKLSDLLIIGKRGVNARFEHGMLGSVAEGVVRRSGCPVLMVPEGFEPVSKPLLAYDGGEHSTALLRSAAELVKPLKLPLTVLSVAPGVEADGLLKDAEDYLAGSGVEAEFASIDGAAADGIVKFHADGGHDLLFMGATHHSRVVSMVLGSTAEHVMRAVPGPVFIQR